MIPVPARGSLAVTGEFVQLEGERYYRISSFDRMEPFLMSIAGDGDLWMFLDSHGGLTAGRVDPDGAIFPYRTVDQLHHAHHESGPITLIRCGEQLWEPFAFDAPFDDDIERSLYKNLEGNRVVFEEIHRGLGLRLRSAWASSEKLGWVRTVTLRNLEARRSSVQLLDGLRNILPYGAPLALHQQAGNLVDAYRRSEFVDETDLAAYSLTAGITDRPEALEVLRANIVWSCGLAGATGHLDARAIAAFRNGSGLPAGRRLNGARGSYLLHAQLELDSEQGVRWHVVVDAMRDQVQISGLLRELRTRRIGVASVDVALREATERLRANVGSADGLQQSASREASSHHFANVLFNNMRGGVFEQNYELPRHDFEAFLRQRNRAVARESRDLLSRLPGRVTLSELLSAVQAHGDRSLERLAYEYLPLHFGRRHGDPSRPWNRFSIRTRNRDGSRELNYEGNWRDIFQNWEALATSFPLFLPSMVVKFLSASTADGHNPYRITREGIDWELSTPEDPWSHIGYWGDHQIVYLTRLLEAMDRYLPGRIGELLERRIFSYANVPYRLRPYAAVVADPRHTIDFDYELQEEIDGRIETLGSDGRLLFDDDGAVLHVNLLEKLVIPALAKLSNLIPDAGIWMNTQRPEWNDANNALAGNGVSVVTLCHLRRYLELIGDRLAACSQEDVLVSSAVLRWFDDVDTILREERVSCAGDGLEETTRRRIMDRLGTCYSEYRSELVQSGLGKPATLGLGRVVDLCVTAREILDWAIEQNRRRDGLYHSYNLLSVDPEQTTAGIERLPLMLEGQVAALSSGRLSPHESLDLLERLHTSPLYRRDQRSYLLYPPHELPSFMETNVVPEDAALGIPLLARSLRDHDGRVVQRDADGRIRFHGDLQCADDLNRVLDGLAEAGLHAELVERDREAVLELFERVFQHRSYTGRSSVMYAFEGLGCIYWHMVAKLLVATQEQLLAAIDRDAPDELRAGLLGAYQRIRSGLGFAKSVDEYGAFPTDPYSHTPARGGAQQPGMTGQVKEEILTRMCELGVRVDGGRLGFDPSMLGAGEFLAESSVFEYFDVHARPRSLPLAAASMAFTVCQVPVLYALVADGNWIEIQDENGEIRRIDGLCIDSATSRQIFERSGRVESVRVHFGSARLRTGESP